MTEQTPTPSPRCRVSGTHGSHEMRAGEVCEGRPCDGDHVSHCCMLHGTHAERPRPHTGCILR